jgi:hypothetical protein
MELMAWNVANAMPSVRKWTDPSQNTKFAPPRERHAAAPGVEAAAGDSARRAAVAGGAGHL